MYEEFISGKVHMKPQPRHFEYLTRAWPAFNDDFSSQKIQSVLEMKVLVYPDAQGRNSAASLQRLG
jgi:hypothetical protein